MSAAAILEWAAAEGVRLVAQDDRITWQADHMPPADLLVRLKEHRQAIIVALAERRSRYRNAVAKAAGVPWHWLEAHYFWPADLADIDKGRYPDPVALGRLIRTDPAHPFGFTVGAAADRLA